MEFEDVDIEPRVAVVGVGGAGCNVIDSIYNDYPAAETIAVNTDKDALHSIRADKKLYICKSVTKGEGTKGDSLLGRRCAQAHLEEIQKAISGHDAVFIVAGMGGGTGTGAAPIIAEMAQHMNMMTFTIAIDPFSFETARRNTANAGISRIRSVCPMTVVVENDLAAEKMCDSSVNATFKAVNRSISTFIQKQTQKMKADALEELKGIWNECDVKQLPDSIMSTTSEMSTKARE